MVMMQRVWSKTSEQWIKCNWCREKDGFENFKTILHDHSKLIPCSHYLATHINYIFCSQNCMNYYTNAPRDNNNLPAGAKHVV
jgi:hypothetical protein